MFTKYCRARAFCHFLISQERVEYVHMKGLGDKVLLLLMLVLFVVIITGDGDDYVDDYQKYVNESDEQGHVELAISMIMMIMMLISDLKLIRATLSWPPAR